MGAHGFSEIKSSVPPVVDRLHEVIKSVVVLYALVRYQDSLDFLLKGRSFDQRSIGVGGKCGLDVRIPPPESTPKKLPAFGVIFELGELRWQIGAGAYCAKTFIGGNPRTYRRSHQIFRCLNMLDGALDTSNSSG
jgi:hypothetical protein